MISVTYGVAIEFVFHMLCNSHKHSPSIPWLACTYQWWQTVPVVASRNSTSTWSHGCAVVSVMVLLIWICEPAGWRNPKEMERGWQKGWKVLAVSWNARGRRPVVPKPIFWAVSRAGGTPEGTVMIWNVNEGCGRDKSKVLIMLYGEKWYYIAFALCVMRPTNLVAE